MAFNLNVFKNALIGEGARGTLFDVILTFPGGLGGVLASTKLNFTCKAAQLPGKTLGVIEVPYFGRKIKVAGDQTFAEWTVTVINDEDFVVRNAFETWMSGINQHNANLRTNLNYHASAIVNQYSKTGAVIKTYKFESMWPSDLAPIDVSWEANDTIEEYTITLNYNWWESIGTTDQG